MQDASGGDAGELPGRRSGGRVKKVLLAEDDDRGRDILRRVLEDLGYVVLEAASPPEAVGLAREHAGAIDLLLTDVFMPGMTGAELALGLGDVLDGAKILFMSGELQETLVSRRILRPQSPFLGKPFDVDALQRAIQRMLGA